MNWKIIKDRVSTWLARFFLVVGILATIGGFVYKCSSTTKTDSTPVEKERIDSITKENDKLIIEVEHLDSIKDAKVIEVKSLDNDSTLRLFYQLIGK